MPELLFNSAPFRLQKGCFCKPKEAILKRHSNALATSFFLKQCLQEPNFNNKTLFNAVDHFAVYLLEFAFVHLDDLAVISHYAVKFALYVSGLSVNGT